ncbi:MAG: hypothetical protein QOC78_2464 [Solirubrobacteraceae bacterium]|jgi:hypothetical protein|nr:hypothetical protein [Solirubrobacteraceae bacterium]
MPALPRLLAATLAVAALLPAAAHASTSMETGIGDDGVLLNGPPDAAATAVSAWAALGIDDVRIFAQWQAVVPANGEVRPPDGFDGSNPDSPGYDWSKIDRAVSLVSAAGMRPMLVITGPGPLWGSQVPARGNIRYKPRPDLFGQFARAVALRYAGAVDRYIIWNEPNLPLWLQPQNTCKRRGCTPYAPHLYRRLVRAAYPAVKLVDPSATVLFGALAPRGESQTKANARTRPLAFIREMGCVDSRLRRDRRGSCSAFKPLAADGFAYHPHSIFRAPDDPQPQPDEASMGDLRRLERTLDRTQRAGGFVHAAGGRFELYFTEWGYQTRPPDPIQGVTLTQQSRWLQQGTYVAYKDPRVRLLTQYEWRDEALGKGSNPLSKYSGWQSGLNFADGRPKPSLRSFANPFFVSLPRGSRRALLWGQVRPGLAHVVTVERRRPGTKGWTTIRRLSTNADGYWTLRQTVSAPTQFRFTWQPTDPYGAADGPVRASDTLRVAPARRLRRG